MTIIDVAVVGAGPAGLSAALMLGRCRRSVIVIDAGKPRNAAAQGLHGFLGHDGINPQELRARGRRELATYAVELIEDEVTEATCLLKTSEQPFRTAFSLHTRGGREMTARKVLFATGVSDELPALSGIHECYGISVHHCPFCDAWEHRGKRLLGFARDPNAAAGLSLSLRCWSDDVTALTNGSKLDQRLRARLASNGIKVVDNPVEGLVHQDGHLHGVALQAGNTLPADALFFDGPQASVCHLPESLGCEIDHEAPKTGDHQTTTVRGVFLAGDADKDVQFAIVAATEGAIAATAIHRELQDEDQGC